MSITNTEQAFTDLKRMGAFMKGVVALADELEGIASLQELTTKTRADALEATGEFEAVTANHGKAMAEMAAEIATAEATLAGIGAMVVERRELILTARAEHEVWCSALKENSKADAEKTAAKIIAKAHEDAAENVRATRSLAETQHTLNNDIMKARAVLDGLNAQIAAIAEQFARK